MLTSPSEADLVIHQARRSPPAAVAAGMAAAVRRIQRASPPQPGGRRGPRGRPGPGQSAVSTYARPWRVEGGGMAGTPSGLARAAEASPRKGIWAGQRPSASAPAQGRPRPGRGCCHSRISQTDGVSPSWQRQLPIDSLSHTLPRAVGTNATTADHPSSSNSSVCRRRATALERRGNSRLSAAPAGSVAALARSCSTSGA